jgi:AMP deaminase
LTDYVIKQVKGVYQVYRSQGDAEAGKMADGYDYPDLDTYVTDMHLMCALIADGPLKSFCYRRLSYLSSKYQLHVLLNELRELAAQKAVAHRDFYNVRKVLFQLGLILKSTSLFSSLHSRWTPIFMQHLA